MSEQLADVIVIGNDDTLGVMPGTVVWDEGLGEQIIRTVSVGGGETEDVFANDLSTNFATLKFNLPATIPNIDLLLAMKQNRNRNVFQVLGETEDGKLSRTFQRAALIGKYDIPVGTETDIEVEIRANKPI